MVAHFRGQRLDRIGRDALFALSQKRLGLPLVPDDMDGAIVLRAKTIPQRLALPAPHPQPQSRQDNQCEQHDQKQFGI